MTNDVLTHLTPQPHAPAAAPAQARTAAAAGQPAAPAIARGAARAAAPANAPVAAPANAPAAAPAEVTTAAARAAVPGRADRASLAAVQAALAAEHAAVYGYGVVGGRINEGRRDEAREAHSAHRARRDALRLAARGLGGRPEPAAAAYALPFAVPDSAAAVRLAAELEDRVAAVYAEVVRATEGAQRREAAAALREAAVRSVRWRGSGVAFPGLAERGAASSAPSGSPSPDGTEGVGADTF